MSATIYDEIEIEDFDFDPEMKTFYYPCPCGDRFQITEVSFEVISFSKFIFIGRINRWRRNSQMPKLFFDDTRNI